MDGKYEEDAGGFATDDDAMAQSVVSEMALVTHTEEMAASILRRWPRQSCAAWPARRRCC